MKKIWIGIVAVIVVVSACNSSDSVPEKAKEKDKYEQTKATLADSEKKNPERFVTVSSHDRKNLLGQRVIKGTLTNTAKVSSFKDVELELNFYSKTGALLEKDHETIYETIAPGSSADFKTKYFAPKGSDSVVLKVTGAKSDQ